MTKDKGQISQVLIVGGGIIGLTIARELHKKGLRKITILERGEIGKEASFAAAGMLAPQAETDKLDDFYYFCDESNKLYPQFAAELLDETGIDIELDREGTLYLAFNETDVAEIRRRFEWQKNAGLKVEHLSAQETRQIEPFVSPDVLESLFFPNDWQVENRQVLHALEKYCKLNEIQLLRHERAYKLLTENDKAIGVKTPFNELYADIIISATGAWEALIRDYISPSEIKPIRGQMISFQTAKRLFSKVIYSPRGYLVPRADGRVLVGATVEDVGFRKEVTAEGIEFLRENAFEIAPSLINLPIYEKWCGLRPFAADGLPLLGSFPPVENFFIATAHYRNGILLAPLTAKILTEKITENQDSVYLKVFSPDRFSSDGLRTLKTTV